MASCTQIESLIQAYLDHELPSAERVVFEQHLSGCPSCRRTLAAQQAVAAEIFEAFTPYRLQASLRSKVLAHLPEIDHARSTPRPMVWHGQERRQRFQWLRMWAPMMAPVLVILLGMTLWFAWPPNEVPFGRNIGMVTSVKGAVTKHAADSMQRLPVHLKGSISPGQRFETMPGATLMVALAGPTLVKAAENTRFKVNDDRRINLEEGHLWFKVAKDERLFRVETPSGGITVFGTTFDVTVNSGTPTQETVVTVTVAEGLVQVDSDDRFTQLHPGQQVDLTLGSRLLAPRQVDAEAVMAWADGIQLETPVEQRLLTAYQLNLNDKPGQWQEQTLMIDVLGKSLRSVVLNWRPDEFVTGHSGYLVYVFDNRMNEILKDYIDGHVFDFDDDNSYVMNFDNVGIDWSDISALRISLVPDHTGIYAASFEDPSASE